MSLGSPGNYYHHGLEADNRSQTQTGMISTSSLSYSEGRTLSRFPDTSTLWSRTTETELTSISDSIINNDKFIVGGVVASRLQGGDVNSISMHSTSSGSSRGKKEGKKIRAVGRGGIGNIIVNTDTLEVDYVDEADILRRRRLLAQFNPRAKISNTGRGGTGNILAASASAPYDHSKDPDDEYEKIVQLEAQKKRMQQMVSTGRGGSGNVRNIADEVKRPRSKSLSMFNKKKRKGPALSRPSTGSTVASNASSSEHHELGEYRLASSVWIPPKPKFSPPHAPRNTASVTATPTPSTPNLSVGSSRTDQSDTSTPRQVQHLAVSSAPPPQPVWKLQYPKQPERKQPHVKESTKDKEPRGKWWKKSTKKRDDEDDLHVESSKEHASERSRPRHRFHPDSVSREEVQPPSTSYSTSRSEGNTPTPTPTPGGIPRIPMRNPQVPSHIPSHIHHSPEVTERSLSPGETQILDEVLLLAESKMQRNGQFDMHDLQEVLMQARHLHQQTATVHDGNHSLPSLSRHRRTEDHLPSRVNTSSGHEHTQKHQERHRYPFRKEQMNEYDHHSSSLTAQEVRDYPLASSPLSNPSPRYLLSSSASDGDMSEHGSTAFSERDAQSISSRSLKTRRGERQVYEHHPELQVAHVQRNVVRQRSDSALGPYYGEMTEHNQQLDVDFGLHQHQLAMKASGEKLAARMNDINDEEYWSLEPVHEEDIYIVEEEEPYTSFIDI